MTVFDNVTYPLTIRKAPKADVDDCRVRIGDTLVRVITDGHAYGRMRQGQEVRLSVRDFIVFPDDGSLEEMLRIKT